MATVMSRTRLTEAQTEAGERYLTGAGGRNDASLWSKARGRLKGEERWRALVDLSVRETLLAGVENQDPYILVELAWEAIERMEPLGRVRLLRELERRYPPGDVGVPLGTMPGRSRFFHPEIRRLVEILEKAGEEGLPFSEYRRAAEEAEVSRRKAKRWAEGLDEHIETWTKALRRKRPGRPKEVRWIRLTSQGRALANVLRGPALGPGDILRRPRLGYKPLEPWVVQKVQAALEEAALKAWGLWPAILFRWLEGDRLPSKA
ncbi:MAG: hypothetical protein V3U30_03725 [Thermoplasmata archaeon]